MLKASSYYQGPQNVTKELYNRNEKSDTIRKQNVVAVKSVLDLMKTSLGPLGMDKLINLPTGDVLVTNDGATILEKINTTSPIGRIMCELSKAQDIEVGDGTTSVVIFASALIQEAMELLEKGYHAQSIIKGLVHANFEAQKIVDELSINININDKNILLDAVKTSVQSKVVSSLASSISQLAVDAVLSCCNKDAYDVDLTNIRVYKQIGSTIDDSYLFNGLILNNQVISRMADGPTRCENAKIALIQFCISLPKAYMDQQILVKDYTSIDRLLRQEKLQIAKIVRQIKATGCNVLLIQKSIMREAVSQLALEFLAKSQIMVIKDIEREDLEHICKTLKCEPISSIEHLTKSSLAEASLVEEEVWNESRLIRFHTSNNSKTISVVLCASNQLTLDEAERSFRDASCIVRCLLRNRGLIPGGTAVEIELRNRITEALITIPNAEAEAYKAFAKALEVIPFTLAENAGLNSVEIVAKLIAMHNQGKKYSAIDIKNNTVCEDIIEQAKIMQPTLVTKTMLKLATETAIMVLRIDDIVLCK